LHRQSIHAAERFFVAPAVRSFDLFFAVNPSNIVLVAVVVVSLLLPLLISSLRQQLIDRRCCCSLLLRYRIMTNQSMLLIDADQFFSTAIDRWTLLISSSLSVPAKRNK